MRSHRPLARRKLHRQVRIELRHDDVPILIRKRQQHPMLPFLDLLEPEPARDRALRMRDRRLEPPQRIERPDNVQLPRMLRRRVAKRKDFQLHGGVVAWVVVPREPFLASQLGQGIRSH